VLQPRDDYQTKKTHSNAQAITSGLRLEIAGSGVRVLSVQPGATKTALAAVCTDKEFLEKSKFDLTVLLEPDDVARYSDNR
jgi:NADP-dependent 3-hydroxy acid dehydrogenase YdfG